MQSQFKFKGSPAEVHFGYTTETRLQQIAEERALTRIVVLSTPEQAAHAALVTACLGERIAGHFSGATMHTPTDVTRDALALVKGVNADAVISFGGGSTIGLGKAIRLHVALTNIAVPTTYAGSETTSILGQTENGRKTTLRNDALLPEVVIYDPHLTLGLPAAMTANSAMNALAHAIEGLYAQDKNPFSAMMAVEGIRSLSGAMEVIARTPEDTAARSAAQYGTWLCGNVLNSVGMALHHKLCHTLGGSFNLPHAETHAVMLPYTVAYNAAAASVDLEPLTAIYGADIASGIKVFSQRIGAAQSLSALGLTASQAEQAANIALENPYWNPAPLTHSGLVALLRDALTGADPRPYSQI